MITHGMGNRKQGKEMKVFVTKVTVCKSNEIVCEKEKIYQLFEFDFRHDCSSLIQLKLLIIKI